MLPSKVPLPHLYRILDGFLRPLASRNWSLTRLDSAALHQAAVRRTGLDDFGDTYYQGGLDALLDSVAQDAAMHAYGRFVFRIMLLNYLSQRLYFEDAQKKKKDSFLCELNPPIIITGLPRSGTTFMHRLLSAHSELMGIPYWQLFRPFPTSCSVDLRKWQAVCELNLLRPALQGLGAKHLLRACEPEEDIWLTGLTFHSPVYWILAPVARYVRWFLDVDRTKAYKEYALLLHWFQSMAPSKTLVMKAPDHMPDLEKLLSILPNARVIQLQRDPETCVLSLSSLLYSTHRLFTHEFKPKRIYEVNRSLISYYLEENSYFYQDRDPQNNITDVDYETFIADPIGVFNHLSALLGMEQGGQKQEYFEVIRKGEKRIKNNPHRYTAEQFGVKN